jgi:hypothetical protein
LTFTEIPVKFSSQFSLPTSDTGSEADTDAPSRLDLWYMTSEDGDRDERDCDGENFTFGWYMEPDDKLSRFIDFSTLPAASKDARYKKVDGFEVDKRVIQILIEIS